MDALPKLVATCIDDDEVLFYGSGNTPDSAIEEFVSSGEFDNHCAYYELLKGDLAEVFIYTVIDPKYSDYDQDELNPNWKFVLQKKIDTRQVEVR